MATSKSPPMPTRNLSPGTASRLKRPMLGLLVLMLVAGASIATTWMITTRYQKQSAASQSGPLEAQAVPVAPAAPPPAPIFVPLTPITVTLQGDDIERMLHVAITLRVGDAESRERLEKYMPEVRSRILMVLSAQSPVAVQSQKGKVALAQALMQSVNKPFAPQPESQSISDVLFTEFVVQ